MSELDAVILDLVESKKLSIAALRFIFLRKNQFKRTSLNRPLLFSCPLRANDLFKSSAERNESRVNGVLQTARYYYDSRSFQLSISYKFGNKGLRAKRHQTGNYEERNRTGN